jgi:3-deoxy-D-manno-octulosonate 8-phosphate phosphatase (KDO 8-P phosphatase)
MASIKAQFSRLKAVVLDVDGVLTDGSIVVTAQGEENRIMNTKDGFALNHAAKVGFPVWVISGGKSPGVATRLHRLGLKEVHLGIDNKLEVLQTLLAQNNINASEVLYMGDDLPDYHCMKTVGIAACPADSAPEIKAMAHYVVPVDGGKGCVRHLLREVLLAKGLWFVSDAVSS